MIDPHYREARLAALYDLDSPWAEDTDFYIGRIGSKPQRILDLGCGTGTLCLGLAERGHVCTGVDPAQAMLDVAMSKPLANRVRWICESAQTLDIAERFDWIVMTGHAFQTLVDDADIHAALVNMARHAAPGGRIAFETRNPAIDWDQQWRGESTWATSSGTVRQVRSGLSVTGETVRFHHDFHFPDATIRSASELRFLTEDGLRAHLTRAGLTVEALLGDWRSGEFDPSSSLEMIVIAHLA